MSSSRYLDASDGASTPTQRPLSTDDDDDMSFELAAETTDDTATEDEEMIEFIDAQDGTEDGEGEGLTAGELLSLLGEEDSDDQDVEYEPATDDNATADEESQQQHDEDEDEDEEAPVNTTGRTHIMRITRNHLIRFMRARGGHPGWPNSLHAMFAGIDDDDDDDYAPYGRSNRRPRPPTSDFPKVPSDEGKMLMESGNFGTNVRDEGSYERKRRLGSLLMRRELALGSSGKQRSINRLASQGLIPSSRADTIIKYDTRCYSGQFSDDGNFFFSCSQDFHVRMYDTSNPYDWKYYKTVLYPFGSWTITDASLSPDNRFLAYSSIRSVVCLASTDPAESSDPHFLDFAGRGLGHFGIWSIRFSGDGRELVAGTGDRSVCAYDIETRKTVLHIDGHEDDVNAVCFGDKMSPHLLYSGSDDATIKVWDRRSMSERRAAGVFLGHTEGLTYIDSKGDGRYVLSNGKDQTMKLWDLRKMVPTEKADQMDPLQYALPFDYRFDDYDTSRYYKHPDDCSLVTFRGHSVLKTLIRCHFSPPGSTDSRYVYSASEDGKVYIYNMDATIAGKVDVRQATNEARVRGAESSGYADFDVPHRNSWRTCVRDASWHPTAPLIAATSWNGYNTQQGTCSVHSWNDGMEDDEGEPRMGRCVNERLIDSSRDGDQAPSRLATLRARARRARAMHSDEDDD